MWLEKVFQRLKGEINFSELCVISSRISKEIIRSLQVSRSSKESPRFPRSPQKSPEFPRIPQDSLELFRTLQDFPRLSRTVQDSPGLLGTSQDFSGLPQEFSKTPQSTPELLRSHQKSQKFPWSPWEFHKISELPKISRNFSRFQTFLRVPKRSEMHWPLSYSNCLSTFFFTIQN